MPDRRAVADKASIAKHGEEFYLWTEQQGGFLRSGQLALADLATIAEEIEDLGKSEFSALVSE